MDNFKVALVQYDTTEPENARNTALAIKPIEEAKGESAPGNTAWIIDKDGMSFQKGFQKTGRLS